MLNLSTQNIIIVYLLIINLVALLVMSWDKKSSREKGKRISERTLFSLALLFGSLGIFLGMWLWRHKTKKWYFLVGIPLLLAENIYVLFKLLTKV